MTLLDSSIEMSTKSRNAMFILRDNSDLNDTLKSKKPFSKSSSTQTHVIYLSGGHLRFMLISTLFYISERVLTITVLFSEILEVLLFKGIF